jgi:hypothetical protein
MYMFMLKKIQVLVVGTVLLAGFAVYQIRQGGLGRDASLSEAFDAMGGDAASALALRVSTPAKLVVLSMDTRTQPLLERQIRSFINEGKRLGFEVLARETISFADHNFPGESPRIIEEDYIKLLARYAQADVLVAFDIYPQLSAARIDGTADHPRLAIICYEPLEAEKWIEESGAEWVIIPSQNVSPTKGAGDDTPSYFSIYDVRSAQR